MLDRRRINIRAVVGALVLSLVAASCGSRVDHDDIVAAAGSRPATGAESASVLVNDGIGAPVPTDPGEPSAAGGVSKPTPDATVSSAGAAASASDAAGVASSTADEATMSPDQSGSERPGRSAGQTQAGSPIRIGVVGTISGAAGASLKPLTDGVRVWATAVNAKGGVNGHQVEVLVADDGGDPARHRALVQEFVEQKGVIAFVANPEALTGESSVDYLTKQGIPVIGSDAAGQYFYDSPVYFPHASHGNALLQASVFAGSVIAKQRGQTKLATITCLEVQVCRDAHQKAKALAAKYGLEVVYQAQASLGQPDFTSQCLNAQSAGAQIISIAMDANAIRAIAAACARQGYRPTYTFSAAQVVSSQAEDPNLDGAVIAAVVAPWTASDTPRRKEFHDAMATYAAGSQATGGHMMGWVSGKVLELGAASLPEPPTSAALVEGLQAIHGDVLPDLTGPLLFNRGGTAEPTVCGYSVIIKGGSFVPGDGGQRRCTDYDPDI